MIFSAWQVQNVHIILLYCNDCSHYCVYPWLRLVILYFTFFKILTELEYSGVGRNKEQSARMLGHLVSNAPRLIRPYMEPILKVCATMYTKTTSLVKRNAALEKSLLLSTIFSSLVVQITFSGIIRNQVSRPLWFYVVHTLYLYCTTVWCMRPHFYMYM